MDVAHFYFKVNRTILPFHIKVVNTIQLLCIPDSVSYIQTSLLFKLTLINDSTVKSLI